MGNPKKNFAERFLALTAKMQKPLRPKAPGEVIYGDMHNRTFAALIDIILLLPIILVLPTLLLSDADAQKQTIIINSYQFIVIGIYNIYFTHKCGATPGKVIVGLKVVDIITNDKLTLSQCVIRYLAYVTFPLGMLFGSFRRNKRTWHDHIADTVVIFSSNRWYKLQADRLKQKVKSYFNMR